MARRDRISAPAVPEASGTVCAVVAQLVRALDCGSRGRWFESTQPYHPVSIFLPFHTALRIVPSPQLAGAPAYELGDEASLCLLKCFEISSSRILCALETRVPTAETDSNLVL